MQKDIDKDQSRSRKLVISFFSKNKDKQGFLKHVMIKFLINYFIFAFFEKISWFQPFWKICRFAVLASNSKKLFLQMNLKTNFWHGKLKTYLVSYKLFKFDAKPKKSADLAHFWKFAVLLFWLQMAKSTFRKWIWKLIFGMVR